MKILVTGASGFVGSALTSRLTEAGHEVLRLVRGPASPGSREWCWDPVRGEVDTRLRAGVEAVVHLAGENIAAGRWTAARKRRIRDSRLKGTEVLARTLGQLRQPPLVFIAASATGFYGNRGAEVLDEESPPGTGFLAELAVAWEKASAPLIEAGVRVVWLRLGMVLGRQGGALARMLPVFRCGAGGVLGSGNQYWSWIHLEDLLQIISRILADTALRGPINAVSPRPVTNREFTRVLGVVLRRPTFLLVPAFALRWLLGEMAEEVLLGSARAMPGRLLSAGHTFSFPELPDALGDLVGKGMPGR